PVRGHQVSSLVGVTLRGGDPGSEGFNHLDVHRRHRCLPSGLAPLRALACSFASGTPGVSEASEPIAGGFSGVTTRAVHGLTGPEVAGGARTGHIRRLIWKWKAIAAPSGGGRTPGSRAGGRSRQAAPCPPDRGERVESAARRNFTSVTSSLTGTKVAST